MDTSSLPTWAQAIFYLVTAVGAASVGLWGYFKKEGKSEASTAAAASSSVISASLIDSKLLKELVEAIREFQDDQGRDLKKLHRLLQDLKESMNELNEATLVQTDTTMNLVRFVNRKTTRNSLVDDEE